MNRPEGIPSCTSRKCAGPRSLGAARWSPRLPARAARQEHLRLPVTRSVGCPSSRNFRKTPSRAEVFRGQDASRVAELVRDGERNWTWRGFCQKARGRRSKHRAE
eukprot:6209162-Pleurochrysis_carterae.AAC.1